MADIPPERELTVEVEVKALDAQALGKIGVVLRSPAWGNPGDPEVEVTLSGPIETFRPLGLLDLGRPVSLRLEAQPSEGRTP